MTSAEKACLGYSKPFIFFDKGSGTRRFNVKAKTDGSLPVDQAANLLAVHCLMNRQMPNDFELMVAAGEELFSGIKERAQDLIHACIVGQTSFPLTGREQEVLHAVQQSLSNKEIGLKLNISVRTVKFHVSALLSKFGVDSRKSLMRQNSSGAPPARFAAHRDEQRRTISETYLTCDNS